MSSGTKIFLAVFCVFAAALVAYHGFFPADERSLGPQPAGAVDGLTETTEATSEDSAAGGGGATIDPGDQPADLLSDDPLSRFADEPVDEGSAIMRPAVPIVVDPIGRAGPGDPIASTADEAPRWSTAGDNARPFATGGEPSESSPGPAADPLVGPIEPARPDVDSRPTRPLPQTGVEPTGGPPSTASSPDATGARDGSGSAGGAGMTASTASGRSSAGPSVERQHVVRPGETLSAIAAELYGDASKWILIERANPDVVPTRLGVGTVLRVPPVSAQPATTSASTNPRPRPGVYVVQPGDSLYGIARRELGEGTRWIEIYQANRVRIGPDPAALAVGMELTMPAARSAG